jgi:phosphohistidine phosphatase
MKTLFLMRHAKAAADDAGTDHERPLTSRGTKNAASMGELLGGENLVPQLIMSSSAVRARDTAIALAEACEWKPELRIVRALYLADAAAILAQAARASDSVESLMIVGHNPAMEDVVSELAGNKEHFPTSAIARFTVPSTRWSEISNRRLELVRIWRAKEID